MPRIIKLHGCSGAGKTTVVRALLAGSENVTVVNQFEGIDKPEAYVCGIVGLAWPVAILGSYKNNCGGMDTYASDSGSIIELIEGYRRDCHILFEGLLLSTYHGAVGKHLDKYGDDYIMAFMDTPLDVCLTRIEARRREQNTTTKFNPELTKDKFQTIIRLKERAIAAGKRVVDITHTEPLRAYGQIVSLLGNAS